jgi:hypothetical protein
MSLILMIPLTLFIALPVLGAFETREQPWETIESYGRCKLRTRGVHTRGDILGRGKHYDLEVKSLWRSGSLLLDNVRDFEWTRDNRWGFVTCQADPGTPIREIVLVDLQTGRVERRYALPGSLMTTCMDSAGLRIAFGIQDDSNSSRSHLVTIDTTQPGLPPRTVYTGPGNVLEFPSFSWSPDSSAIAFVSVHWRTGGTRFTFLHVRLDDPPVVLELPGAPPGAVDWTDPQRPR